MALTPIPNITCGFGISAVIVRAYRVLVSPQGLESPPIPISGANVNYGAGTFPFAEEYNEVTNSVGIASHCFTNIRQVVVKIKKSDEDFGSGINQWHTLTIPFRTIYPVFTDAKSIRRETPIPVCSPPQIYNFITGKCETPILPTLPCTGKFTQPDVSSLLDKDYWITTPSAFPPTFLFIPVKLTGDRTSVPIEIWVGGTRVASQPTGFTGFDLIKTIKDYSYPREANFNIPYTITIKSTATDCKIPDLVIPIKPLAEATICTLPQIRNIITGKCETPSIPGCDKLITTAETPSHPKEITDFNSTFYVYLRGIKEVCESDPTNPAFISKLPKGTMGTIKLGSLSSNFYLTDDGITDIDLSKLIDLPSLIGAVGAAVEVTPSPVAVTQPSAAVSGERIGSYCTLTPMKTTFAMAFFDVFHDTLGKIYSGNTYDQAKYKAQKDERCFLTVTQIAANEYTPAQWDAMTPQQKYDTFKKGFEYRTAVGTIFNYDCNTCSPNAPPGFSATRPAGGTVFTYKGFGTSTKDLSEAWRIYIKANGGSP